MKTTFIISYRNRAEHLAVMLPVLREHSPDAEIMVVEQNDNNKFRLACLHNVGVQHASGDIVVLHNVDHVPTPEVKYHDGVSDVYLPMRYAKFVYNDLTEKPLHLVPGGYQSLVNGIETGHYEGVATFTKEAYNRINGTCPLYVGWGFENIDLMHRVRYFNLTMAHDSTNVFYVLHHPDSGPSHSDVDFVRNIHRCRDWHQYLDYGISNQYSKTEEITPRHPLVDRWLLATDFDGPSHIVYSKF
jgi:hypothetical protein